MKKLFSIGSRKETAKQVDINLNPKHIKFGVVIFILALLFHMFVYSPYLKTEYKIVCTNDEEIVKITDNMDIVCGHVLPKNDMTSEEIYNYMYEKQIQEQLGVLID